MKNDYSLILNFYQKLLKKKGFNLEGQGWNSAKKNQLRLKYFYSIISHYYKRKITLLDFGCGLSNLYVFLKKKKLKLSYAGIDTSKEAFDYSSTRFRENKYYHFDILKKTHFNQKFDVIILSGIFTIKDRLSDKKMYKYIFDIIYRLKKNCKGVLIINFLTSNPDWKNKKNFYPEMEKIFKFVHNKVSKNYSFFHSSHLLESFLVIKVKK